MRANEIYPHHILTTGYIHTLHEGVLDYIMRQKVRGFHLLLDSDPAQQPAGVTALTDVDRRSDRLVLILSRIAVSNGVRSSVLLWNVFISPTKE